MRPSSQATHHHPDPAVSLRDDARRCLALAEGDLGRAADKLIGLLLQDVADTPAEKTLREQYRSDAAFRRYVEGRAIAVLQRVGGEVGVLRVVGRS